MRTTLHLPDELFRQAKAKAALDGTTLKALVTRCVADGLQQPAPSTSPVRPRSPLPVIERRGKQPILNLTANRQAQCEMEEGVAD